MDDDAFLTTAMAAELLGLSRQSVTTLAYEGHLPGTRFYRTTSGERTTIRIPRSAVEALIARSLDPDAAADEPDRRP